MRRLLNELDEKTRRKVAGALSLQLGHGGIEEISALSGLSRTTIRRGRDELQAEDPHPERVRAPGGGRPSKKKT